MSEQGSLADDQINQSFGYKQELRRALKLFSLYAVAFSIISITTGISLNYAAAIGAMGPASIWLWIVASAGQLLVALVVAELGTRIPLAGYSYQWGARLVNTAYGWFTGFIGLAYLSVGAAAINYLVVAPLVATLLQPVIHTDPGNALTNLVITLVIFAGNLVINILSIALPRGSTTSPSSPRSSAWSALRWWSSSPGRSTPTTASASSSAPVPRTRAA